MKTLARILLATLAVTAPVAWSSSADAAPAHTVVAHRGPVNPTQYISAITLHKTGLVSTTCADYGKFPSPLSASSQRWVAAFCNGHGGTRFVRHLGWCFRVVSHDAAVGQRPSSSCVATVDRYAYLVPNFGVAQFTAAVHAPADVLAMNLAPQVFPVAWVTHNGHRYI